MDLPCWIVFCFSGGTADGVDSGIGFHHSWPAPALGLLDGRARARLDWRGSRKALRALGMDGAVTYAFLARLTGIVGSTGTVLLIVRLLSPVEQGYYYTLLSLVSLQIVFEMGFSFVIQQLAPHETVHLVLHPDGRIEGDRV